MKRVILWIVFAVCACCFAEDAKKPVTRLWLNGDDIILGHKEFEIRMDFHDGRILSLKAGGQTMLEDRAETALPWLQLETAEHRVVPVKGGKWRVDCWSQPAKDVVCAEMRCGLWNVKAYTRLDDKKLQVTRWYDIRWEGTSVQKLFCVRQHFGRLKFGSESYLSNPGSAIPSGRLTAKETERSGVSLFSDSSARTMIFQQEPARSLVFLTDELADGFEPCRGMAVSDGVGAVVSVEVKMSEDILPQHIRRIGDYWMWVQSNDGEQALKRIHEWYHDRGNEPSAACPKWLESASLYCFQRTEKNSRTEGVCGIAYAGQQLKRISKLNCNTLVFPKLMQQDIFNGKQPVALEKDVSELLALARIEGLRVLVNGTAEGTASGGVTDNWLEIGETNALDTGRSEAQDNGRKKAFHCMNDDRTCRSVMPLLRKKTPLEYVRLLSRWLHEQQYTEPQGILRTRPVGSPGSVGGEQLYGPGGLRANFAVTAWLHGIPVIDMEMEDGHSPVMGKVLAIRNALVEISQGEQDTVSVRAPAGVFAVLRQSEQPSSPAAAHAWDTGAGPRAFVGLVSFEPITVAGVVSIPLSSLPEAFHGAEFCHDLWNGGILPVIRCGDCLEVPVTVPPFGMGALRFGGVEKSFDVASFFGKSEEMLPVEISSIGSCGDVMRPRMVRKQLGTQFPPPRSCGGMLIRVPLESGERCEWRVMSADGVWQDIFRTRHPLDDSHPVEGHHLLQDGNVLWDSRLWPLGMESNQMNISFATPRGEVSLQFDTMECPVAVWLLDHVDDVQEPHVFVATNLPDYPICNLCPLEAILISEGIADDPWEGSFREEQLVFYAGRWKFDNGKIRLWIGRNGILQEFSVYDSDGILRPIISESSLKAEKGFGFSRSAGGYQAQAEMEPMARIDYSQNGFVILRFTGRMRGEAAGDIMSKPVEYEIEYHLNDTDGFGFNCGVKSLFNTAPFMSEIVLSQMLPQMSSLSLMSGDKILGTLSVSGDGSNAPVSQAFTEKSTLPTVLQAMSSDGEVLCRWEGISCHGSCPAGISLAGNQLRWEFIKSVPTAAFAGRWHMFSAWVSGGTSTGNGGDLMTSLQSGDGKLVEDSGFEEWSDAAWIGSLVQSIAVENCWEEPKGGSHVNLVYHGGKWSEQIDGRKGESRMLCQKLRRVPMVSGTRMTMSCWAKANGIGKGDGKGFKGAELRFAWKDVQGKQCFQAVPIDSGTYDWRSFSVDFTVPAGAWDLCVQAGLDGCEGTLWLDDFELKCH